MNKIFKIIKKYQLYYNKSLKMKLVRRYVVSSLMLIYSFNFVIYEKP